MIETNKKWIDKEWSKQIVTGVIALIVGLILLVIPPESVRTSFKAIYNNTLSFLNYKLALWEWIASICTYFCMAVAWKMNEKIRARYFKPKEIEFEEIADIEFEPVKQEPPVDGFSTRKKIMAGTMESETDIRKMLNYTADKWDGINYKWDWVYNDLVKQYEVKYFSPVCSNTRCNYFRMNSLKVIGGFGVYYKCGICNEQHHTLEYPKQLILRIEKKYPHKAEKL
ncbi:hypothetical protein [Pedobacter rhodius]|uniref:Uncharacterized protein n=1 Tax=Pedobacter rhodius TaxID=3004098 RepID=A0ABT4KYG2_9SPHI|nr:hypothetical protein [Pedobacter sp. SJ11]MCZ4223247.1 hypothetical protein [Pedobacter sp. SJ11]